MAEGKTLERSQIEEKYKWNLAVMFENDQAWEKALNSLDDKAKELTGYAGGIDKKIWLLEHEGVDIDRFFRPKHSTAP